jgi:hypothetical protein
MFNNSQKLPIFIISGGFHSLEITDYFIASFLQIIEEISETNICVIPTQKIAPYNVVNIYHFLCQKCGKPAQSSPLIFMSFSAGVVGSIGAGRLWQRKGGIVKSLFAFDGWGVPLIADFPCYRLSHDYFTHLTSLILGGEKNSFYAQPSVSHLDLWRSLFSVQGYYDTGKGMQKTTAREYISKILNETILT